MISVCIVGVDVFGVFMLICNLCLHNIGAIYLFVAFVVFVRVVGCMLVWFW